MPQPPPESEPPPLLQIADAFGQDEVAQRMLSHVKHDRRSRVRRCVYLYANGGDEQLREFLRVLRPDEIVAEKRVAGQIISAASDQASWAAELENVCYQCISGSAVALIKFREIRA